MTAALEAHPKFSSGPVILTATIVCLTAFLFPGDVPFIADEPLLVQSAHIYNHLPSSILGIHLSFTPAMIGLSGSRGVSYGPPPTWIYQLLLATTHNVFAIVMLRALLASGATAIALLWLTRSMQISGWFAPLSMLSPWLWMWHRTLWDNSWCIPLSALAIASYAAFLVNRKTWALVMTLSCLMVATATHLSALALDAAIALHLIFFRPSALARSLWPVSFTILAWVVVFIPYIRAAAEIGESGSAPTKQLSNAGWLLAVWGGHHLTAGFDWLVSIRTLEPPLVTVARAISLLPHLAVWAGMGIVLLSSRQLTARQRPLGILALLIAACQTVLDGIERLPPLPHYFNSTWIAYAILAWLAIDLLRRRIAARIFLAVPIAVYVAAMLLVTGYSIFIIHRNGGTRAFDFGSTLAVQASAAEKIHQFSTASPVEIKVDQWNEFPWAKDVLLSLQPPSQPDRPLRTLVVRYRDAYPGDAHIVVDDYPVAPKQK
jgi:hypothetical protein